MKNITIAGRIGKDAELRQTQGGDSVLGFSVAVDDRSNRDKETIWFDCSVWGKRGETLKQYLTKGTSVAVTGDLGKREHDGKTYLTVRVNDVTMQGGGERSERSSGQSGSRSSGYERDDRRTHGDYGRGAGTSTDLDDEIPF